MIFFICLFVLFLLDFCLFACLFVFCDGVEKEEQKSANAGPKSIGMNKST